MIKYLFFSTLGVLMLTSYSASSPSSASSEKPVVVPYAENAEDIDSSLVTLTSLYTDTQNQNRQVPVKGSGFLVESAHKIFVITASHVSQGKDLQISKSGQQLKILGRLYDGKTDLEIIEVENSLKASFVVSGDSVSWTLPKAIPRAKWIDSYNLTLLNSWVTDPYLAVDNEFQKTRLSDLYCDLYCYLLHAETLMQPGSSGSPMITYIPPASNWTSPLSPYDEREKIRFYDQEKFNLRGMVIRRERFFSSSSFIPTWRIVTLLKSYANGERTPQNPDNSWALSGPTLLRKSINGYNESAATGLSSGNGVSMDGGNLNGLNENNPRETLSQISAFPTDPANKEMMMWIMAVRHPFTSQLINYPVWYDPEQYNQLKKFTLALAPQDPSNLLALLTSRFKKNAIPQEFEDQSGQAKISIRNSEIHIEFKINNDTVQFTLNSRGFLCDKTCIERFDPIIEVTSKAQRNYIVDLRDLFFVNLSKSKSDLFKDPANTNLTDAERNKKFFDYMGGLYQNMSLSIREKPNNSLPLTVQQGLPLKFQWTIL
ncbi:MAG: hypothetical protein V4654_13315 [Bdellovibrionota bacterium]